MDFHPYPSVSEFSQSGHLDLDNEWCKTVQPFSFLHRN